MRNSCYTDIEYMDGPGVFHTTPETLVVWPTHHIFNWLVASTPLTNYKSIGILIPKLLKNKKKSQNHQPVECRCHSFLAMSNPPRPWSSALARCSKRGFQEAGLDGLPGSSRDHIGHWDKKNWRSQRQNRISLWNKKYMSLQNFEAMNSGFEDSGLS